MKKKKIITKIKRMERKMGAKTKSGFKILTR